MSGLAQLGAALLLGSGVGLVTSLLWPLAAPLPRLFDLTVVTAAALALLYLALGICRGDLRLAHTLAMVLGAVAFRGTAGVILSRLSCVGFQFLVRILKNFSLFLKKRFTIPGKKVTIQWNNRNHKAHSPGGDRHGTQAPRKN